MCFDYSENTGVSTKSHTLLNHQLRLDRRFVERVNVRYHALISCQPPGRSEFKIN